MESKRMKRFREAELIGCLNETGVTSESYKEIPSDEELFKQLMDLMDNSHWTTFRQDSTKEESDGK